LWEDFDLGILGRSESGKSYNLLQDSNSYLIYIYPDYEDYVRNIRQEYACYDEITFCKGRIQILKKLLNNGNNIYRNPTFKRKYEAQAQMNIQRELNLLTKGYCNL
jgi:predicted metal-dependent HD superfamily phosphohydrolase